jgi:uncharacterized protein (DUF849 family)
MINNTAQLIKEGYLKKPPYMQFVLGILGGLPATVANLVTLYQTAKEQIGEFNWSVCAAGRNQLKICAAGLAMGGNVRVLGWKTASMPGKAYWRRAVPTR